MASSGADNWNRNWKGSNHQSTVKLASTYYTKSSTGSYTSAGTLNVGTPITYIDNLTTDHTKAAIQLAGNQNTYYINIDKLVKPKVSARAVSLGPGSFGLENSTYTSSGNYYNKIKTAINSRNDIDGELFDYLYELLEYSKGGSGDYVGIKLSGFPWGQLQNYYAEVIGPLACIHRGILNGIVPGNLGRAKIYMPPDSEKLYDYKIISGNNEYLISAKTAKGVSNQVKPQFVTSITRNSGKLGSLEKTTEFRVLDILGTNGVVPGALYAWQTIDSSLSTAAIQDILAVYKGNSHTKKVPNPQLISPFVSKHMTSKVNSLSSITVGEVRYRCEQLIQDWSKRLAVNSVLKDIFNIYLNESRVIYVKMDLNKSNGHASFSASAGGGSSLVHKLYLRSSNYANRTADRIGFQVS